MTKETLSRIYQVDFKIMEIKGVTPVHLLLTLPLKQPQTFA